MTQNTIGFEAEFFLQDGSAELVLPADHGLPHDDFPLLGEIRGLPGSTREEAVSNFLKEYYRILYLTEKKNLRMDITAGWRKLDPRFYAKVVKKMEEKSIPKCQNVYDVDLLNYSDSVVEGGKMVAHKVSIGLHIHFGSVVTDKREFVQKKYEGVNLPIRVSNVDTSLNLFAERGKETIKLECKCSRITKPVIRYIVEKMDKDVHSQFKIDEPLKYRMAGFYECKPDGRVEYRSLPFNEQVLASLPKIADYSFGLLEAL